MNRVILMILDSLGIGHAADAKEFNDEGANTLGSIVKAHPDIHIPNLLKLGLGNINEVDYLPKDPNPLAIHGSLEEVSKGKDTTIGHWEIAGLSIAQPFPVYPDGFPPEIMEPFEKAIGRETLWNKPASGTTILEMLGEEHVATGKPIVYTSGDSVFQIAAHEEVIPIEELYHMCQVARDLLVEEHSVARVIARPFVGTKGNYERTANRRDFSLDPYEPTVLNHLQEVGRDVIGVGKIEDIYNRYGITEAIHTESNMDGVDKTIEYMKRDDIDGLIFVNLVDFDAKFGHRRDPLGYKNAIEEFDRRLPEILENMREDDLLILSADHGNDPAYSGTDHTRERVFLLAYGKNVKPYNFGCKKGFYTIAATISDYLMVPSTGNGESLLR